MKKLISLYLFLSISSFTYSQDTVCLRGYYVQKFLKREIVHKTQNQLLREQNKSFKVMIDLKTQLFFFPLQVNSTISLWTRDLIGSTLQSNQDYKNTEVFYFPPFNEHLKSYFDKLDIPIQHTEFPFRCNYYVNEHDTVHVYKLHYIEGHALRIAVNNDYLNKQRNIDLAIKWSLDPTLINKGLPSFYAYLFYKCSIIQCDFPLEGFTAWNPNH